MHKPWDWSPKILEIQLVQIGSVLICAVPFEITTMASRRLRESLKLGLTFWGYDFNLGSREFLIKEQNWAIIEFGDVC